MEISDSVLQSGARRFSVNTATLHLLGGMDGVVYGYKRDGALFVLKFTPTPAERIPTLRAKLDFVSYLGAHGVSVAKPVPSVDGELIEVIDAGSHAPPDTLYAVTSSERAPGEQAFKAGEWNDRLFEEWGRVIGQMHRLTRHYDEQRTWPDGLVGNWEAEHQSFAQWCEDDAVRDQWLVLGDQLRALPRDRDAFGLIHNDPHPFNFMVSKTDGGLRLTFFDFDVCNYHFFMTDVGIAMYHALLATRPRSESAGAFARRFLQHFMQGYSRENSLAEVWVARLPMFLKYRQMLLHTVFSHEWQHPSTGQADTLRQWRRSIVEGTPVVDLG